MRFRYWMPIFVLALGIASVLVLFGTDRLRERLMAVDIELGQAVRDVQTQLSKSHLWLEEYVTGDEISVDEIWQDRESSQELLRTVLRGSETLSDVGRRRVVATATEAKVRRFWEITEERYEGYQRGESVGVGSPIDVEYDAVFYDLLADLQSLQSAIELRLATNRERWQRGFGTILVAWISLVGLAVAGLWNHERRRLAAEQALGDSQAQLHQSQKMDAVGRLAGGVAHDINNYLAAIRAQCELIGMNAEAGSAVRRKVETVVATTAKAAALITRLLAFSRQEPVQARVTDVNRVVERLSRMLERLLGEDIRLQKRLASDLWHVKIDRSQLEQIIMNLVVNAREAMPSGGTLRLETGNRPSGDELGAGTRRGDDVLLAVADTGPGVPAAIRDQVFEPFFTTKTNNSGLGLSTVYGIVEQNGGVIRLAETGGGGRFEVRLPRCDEPLEEDTVVGLSPVAARSAGCTILLVEDNDELRESVAQALTSLGYEVRASADGEAAMRLAEEIDRVDLMVSDVVMPGISGPELRRRLEERWGELPTIFISGYTDHVVLDHGVSETEVDLLPKPFALADLTQRIDRVLRARS